MEKLQFPMTGQSDLKFDFMTLAKMKVETANAIPGDLTDFDCPKCLNRGYSLAVREDATLVSQVCSCMYVRKNIRQMKQSGLDAIIREKTMDAFQAKEPWQKELKQTAERYAANPTGWLLMCGQPGSGKTHLCTAVCRELLLKGMQVCYMSWREEISQLKDFRSDMDKRNARLSELKTAQVLYVDDLFKTGGSAPTDTDISIAFELFNYRYINHSPTIISTEKNLEQLIVLDEALGSRIAECCANHCGTIPPNRNRNYRLRSVIA